MGIGFLVEPQKRGKFHRNLYLPFIANVCNKDSKPDNKAEKPVQTGQDLPICPPSHRKKGGKARTHSFPRSPAR